jgi:hypothetical protein
LSTAAASDSPEPRSSARIYVAFIPWILFSIIAQHDTLAAAAVVALIAAIVISVPSVSAGRPKLLELGAVAAFAAFTVVALVTDPAVHDWLTRYARAIAAALLALLTLGSLLRTPITEQYARESVPRQFWSTPEFRRVNRQLTLMWGAVFVAMVPSHLIAGAIDTRRGNTIFNWAIPVALVVWAAKRTEAVTDDGARGERGHSVARAPGGRT